MEILLIRHGDPDYGNDCLTDRGKQEAKCLADELQDVPIDEIYVSPLGRAQETCEHLSSRTGRSPVVLEWLRERSIKRGEVWLWNAPGETFLRTTEQDGPCGVYDLDTVMPEGREQFDNVTRGFNDLLATHGYVRQGDMYRIESRSEKRLAFFCHQGVILTLLADLLHWSLPMVFVSLHIHTTGLTRLSMVEGESWAHFRADVINDVTHLRGIVQD